tara:strand:+ start:477 stop:1145 length:669 start_codon:yes stop_codon:yes gene_type:complete
MKKLFASLMLGLSLAGPALAQPSVTPNSLDATGCMKLRECTDNVVKIETYDDIVNHYPFYDRNHEQEITALLAALNASGVEVFIADYSYFPIDTRGFYYTDVNKMFLNDIYMANKKTLLEVMRHEGWHAAQDCMAGDINNTYIAVIHNDNLIPKEHKVMADLRYGQNMPKAIPWEQEAIWSASVPNMTADALNACASGQMWNEYEPTPMTREWLVKNNYIQL